MTTITYHAGLDNVDWKQLTYLYTQVGLIAGKGKTGDIDLITKAFSASSRVITAWDADKLVAAGRMFTDGLCYASIFDVGVLPDYQKRGIGKGVMLELMKGIDHVCVHLTSTLGNEPFYKGLGFKHHKTGMAKYPFPSQLLED